jgi:hypothetical protein
MLDAVREFTRNYPEPLYWIPKYDGSSLGAYYDTSTGRCVKVITIGGSNLGNFGIDQTEKFAGFFPVIPGSGIKMIQAECLISLEHGFGESSRQKANGLVNSSYEPMSFQDFIAGSTKTRTQKEYEKYLTKFSENQEQVKKEVEDYINIRGFRYYIDGPYPDYREGLNGLPITYNQAGDIKFSGGYVMTLEDLEALGPDIVEKDIWTTPTGTFLVDGLVAYTTSGKCVKALKYKDAGRGESVEVLGIKWNNQITKGKDSWSANAIINPVEIRGSVITKPTIGSVKKMITSGISPGARVTLILANSTIPAISEVLEPGNGDYSWPICSCGYQMSEKDVYGSLIKCGNPMCSERLNRMTKYIKLFDSFDKINPDKLFILDRVKLSEIPGFMENMYLGITGGTIQNEENLKGYITQFLTTDLQKRNLELVYRPAWLAITQWITNT